MSTLFPHLNASVAAHRLYSSAKNDFELWQTLKANGVNLDLVTKLAGPIVRSVVTFLPGGLYESDSFGEIALVMAVHDEDVSNFLDKVAELIGNRVSRLANRRPRRSFA